MGKRCLVCYNRARAKRPIVCACGAPKSRGSERCLACDTRHRYRESLVVACCRWCGSMFERRNHRRDRRLYCSRRCHRACRYALKVAAAQARHDAAHGRRCLHCRQPLGLANATGHARLHDACREAHRRQQRPIYISKAVHVERSCFFCERPFVTTTRASTFCSRRCKTRWQRIRRKHGLDRTTDPEIVRAYRLLGDVYVALQRPGELRRHGPPAAVR